MALYVLENDVVKLTIDSFGAEIKSLQNKEKNYLEYMWSGDPTYWKRTSPILFPLVGSLKEQSYLCKGKTYQMSQHGFARDMEFTLEKHTDDEIEFMLQDTPKTREIYPFAFVLRIGYVLRQRTVEVRWHVENTGAEDMDFSIGGHPAFCCPIQEGERQTDYTLSFDEQEEMISSVIGEGGLLTGEKKKYTLQKGILPITADLFDQDALVIEHNQAHQVSLRNPSGEAYITLKFSAPLFGIWSPTGKQAPFICIEPWYGRCDSRDFHGELQDREWGNHLKAKEHFEASYTIQI